jgi:phosphoenolpyruvate-protein kinase (PTS system EI component)
MVMGVADLREARCEVEDALQREQFSKQPPIGAMVETPAAAFDIEGILQIADFVCIGTNDLAHSILAMDRGTQGSPEVLSFLHPSVLRATDHVVRAAVSSGIAVSVCGEAASDPEVACLLVGMGVRNLSMNPFLAARVCHALRHVTIDQAQTLAKEALSATTPREIQEIVASALSDVKGV